MNPHRLPSLPPTADVPSYLQACKETIDACAKDRFAFFPEVLTKGPSPSDIVIWGMRPWEMNPGVHRPSIQSILDANPQVRARGIVGFPSPDQVDSDGWPYVRYADFFANPQCDTSTLIVDRSCTWRDQTPDKERLEALGFSVVRFEQFLMRPY